MIDPDDILLDDRPLIKITGNEVRGSTHNLHAPVIRLVVGPGTLERRQEAMVDIDNPPGHNLA